MTTDHGREDASVVGADTQGQSADSLLSADDLSEIETRLASLDAQVQSLRVSVDTTRTRIDSHMGLVREGLRRMDQSVRELNRATDVIAGQTVSAVDRYFQKSVLRDQEQLVETLQKLLSRLEVRGASPFKSARARILEHLAAKRYIGAKHTPLESSLAGLSESERTVGREALDD